jgi:hypothetical protein
VAERQEFIKDDTKILEQITYPDSGIRTSCAVCVSCSLGSTHPRNSNLNPTLRSVVNFCKNTRDSRYITP